MARLIEEKGLVCLLKSCWILKKRGYSFKCEIIGGTEEPLYTNYYLELKKLHRALDMQNCVFFSGAQPFKQVLEKYKRCDIFVLPCVFANNGGRDITPNSLIEPMAMKLPVISTGMSGIPEIVDDGCSVLLVPTNDENALEEAMIRLIEDDELRRALGENARKKVEERFDISQNIAQYISLFNGSDVIADRDQS